MQIMPGTAASLGISTNSLYEPETNIATATRFIKMVSGKFNDVRNPTERLKFILASYNGGYYHIRDAMNLARKYRRNPGLWNDVSFFVYHLSEPRYYRDPAVRNGYMVGSETYNYVNQIITRWSNYCGVVQGTPMPMMNLNTNPVHAHKKNRFSKEGNILSREDSMFQIPK